MKKIYSLSLLASIFCSTALAMEKVDHQNNKPFFEFKVKRHYDSHFYDENGKFYTYEYEETIFMDYDDDIVIIKKSSPIGLFAYLQSIKAALLKK